MPLLRDPTGSETEDGWRSNGYFDPQYFLDNDRKPDRVPEVFKLTNSLPGGFETDLDALCVLLFEGVLHAKRQAVDLARFDP